VSTRSRQGAGTGTLENRWGREWNQGESSVLCWRQAYLRRVTSWGGWSPEAPLRSRQAYLLSKLSSIPAWAGDIVHSIISERYLRTFAPEARPDGTIAVPPGAPGNGARTRLSLDEALNLAYAEFTWAIEGSRHFFEEQFPLDPKRYPRFLDHFYGRPVPWQTWEKAWHTMRGSLEVFDEHFFRGRIVEIPVEDWRFVDRMKARPIGPWGPVSVPKFDEGLLTFPLEVDGEVQHVYDVKDFLYVDRTAGVFRGVDWKTTKRGEYQEEKHRIQRAVYALGTCYQYGLKPEEVELATVYLAPEDKELSSKDRVTITRFKDPGTKRDARVEYVDLRAAEARIADLIREKRRRFKNWRTTIAAEEDFPMCDEAKRARVCGWCPFVNICPGSPEALRTKLGSRHTPTQLTVNGQQPLI